MLEDTFDRQDVEDVVGSETYIEELEAFAGREFEGYSPEDVLELNRARFVAEEARSDDEAEYAEKVEELRSTLFDPLESFDRKAAAEEFEDMTEREKTFFHYPTAPHDYIEMSEHIGLEQLHDVADPDALERYEGDAFLEQQLRLRAIAEGAREIAEGHYEEVCERFDGGHAFDMEFDYESSEEYAETVAFNATLAAESFFEQTGDLVYPP